ACTQTVQQFISAWVDTIHASGYVAGIYGSASSAIRDMVAIATAGGSAPDQIDIGRWNGQQSVFGEPYVPDSYWANHQRIHQYRGGHKETWGGVTINVDDDYLDGAVAGVSAPSPIGGQGSAGSAVSNDGRVSVSWPAGALPQAATVTVTAETLPRVENGFADGSYIVQVQASPGSGGSPIATFAAPATVTFKPPTTRTVPAFS